MEIADS
jgi:hypothetical protein